MAIADKVAELQDLMRARLCAFEREQEQRWSSMESALANQASALRSAGDDALLRQLDEGLGTLRLESQAFASSSTDELRFELSNLRSTLQLQQGHVRGLRDTLQEHQTELESIREVCAAADKQSSRRDDLAKVCNHDVQSLREELRVALDKVASDGPGRAAVLDDGSLRNSLSTLQETTRQQLAELRRELDERLQCRFDASLPSASVQQEAEVGGASSSSASPSPPALPPAQRLASGGAGSGDTPDMIALQPALERLEATAARHESQLQAQASELAGLHSLDRDISQLSLACEATSGSLSQQQASLESVSNRTETHRTETMRMLGKLALRIEMVAPEARRGDIGGGGFAGALQALAAPL